MNSMHVQKKLRGLNRELEAGQGNSEHNVVTTIHTIENGTRELFMKSLRIIP
jgi:hypothetical protein